MLRTMCYNPKNQSKTANGCRCRMRQRFASHPENEGVSMKKVMTAVTLAGLMGAILFGMLFHCLKVGIFLSLAITCGTVCYHFSVRFLIAFVINSIFRNRMNYERKWFHTTEPEQKLYRKIRVKQWKGRMPTYSPDTFQINRQSIESVVKAMCQSEVIHELNAAFSLAPLLFSAFFGAFWVFFLTSLSAAVFDLLFVMIQRYNRPRLEAMMKQASPHR